MIGPTNILHLSPAPDFKTSYVFLGLLSEVSKFQRHPKFFTKCVTVLDFSSKSNLLVKRVFFCWTTPLPW